MLNDIRQLCTFHISGDLLLYRAVELDYATNCKFCLATVSGSARPDEKRPGFPPTISSASGRPIGRKTHAKEEKKNQVRKRPCLEKIFNLNQQ